MGLYIYGIIHYIYIYVYIIYIPLKNAVCLTANDHRGSVEVTSGSGPGGFHLVQLRPQKGGVVGGILWDSVGLYIYIYMYICEYRYPIYNGLESHTYIYILVQYRIIPYRIIPYLIIPLFIHNIPYIYIYIDHNGSEFCNEKT